MEISERVGIRMVIMAVLGIVGFGVIEPLSESEMATHGYRFPANPKFNELSNPACPGKRNKGRENHPHVDSY